MGSFQAWPWTTVIATAGLVLASVYSLIMLHRACFGPTSRDGSLGTLDGRELAMMLLLVVLVVVIGVYPQPILDTAAPSIDQLLHWFALPASGATAGVTP